MLVFLLSIYLFFNIITFIISITVIITLIIIISLLISFHYYIHNFIFQFHFRFHLIYVNFQLSSCSITLHKKWSFPWRISSVNVTKSTGNWCHDMFIGQRTNRSYGQVKRSHSIPLVLKFYVLILIYFRAIFIEIFFRFWSFVFVGFVLVFSFVNFWYFFYFAKFKCDEMLGSRL